MDPRGNCFYVSLCISLVIFLSSFCYFYFILFFFVFLSFIIILFSFSCFSLFLFFLFFSLLPIFFSPSSFHASFVPLRIETLDLTAFLTFARPGLVVSSEKAVSAIFRRHPGNKIPCHSAGFQRPTTRSLSAEFRTFPIPSPPIR